MPDCVVSTGLTMLNKIKGTADQKWVQKKWVRDKYVM